jgi:hypothetical protein
VRPGATPASGGGEVAMAHPLRLDLRQASDGEDQHAAMGATMGSREELGRVGRRQELAKVRARDGGDNSGSAGGGAHAREQMGAPFYSRRVQRHLASWLSIPDRLRCGTAATSTCVCGGRG